MGSLSLEVEKGLYLGIDFGTTNSVVSIYHYDSDEIHTLRIDGQYIFPTVVQFEIDEENGGVKRIFGREAKEAAVIFPESTVVSIKRLLDSDQVVEIVLEERRFSFEPVAIVAELLSHLKELADQYIRDELGIIGTFSGCVITVPANSTDKFKKRMKKAAAIAGFMDEGVHLRLEPAAAALVYAMQVKHSSKVMVYDFGGGTFDACLLQITEGEEGKEIELLSTYGDNHLGGNDIDQILVDCFYDEFLRLTKNQIDLFDDTKEDGLKRREKKMAISKLKNLAIQTKEKLSTVQSAKAVLAPLIQLPYPVNLNIELSRDDFYQYRRKHRLDDEQTVFENLKGLSAQDLVERSLQCVYKCLEAAKMSHKDVDEIILVGGSSSMSEVKRQIRDFFGKEPFRNIVSPALSISQGAAYYCKQIMLPSENSVKVQEQTVHSVGLEISGRRYFEVVKAGVPIPEGDLVVEAPYTLETNMDDISSLAISVYEDLEPEEWKRKFVYEKGVKRLSGTTLRGIPAKAKGEEKIRVVFRVSRDNTLTVEAQSINTEGVRTVLHVDELYEK
ncbi:MAG: Hsp70 family protein [Vallitaleaceae bacterium]|nr:Hsp70 family protein [Vallitaleaceae bacterium]